ncbi:unnamed protein product [Rotaria sp. Silwood1]|nr:unnamed protein product [Rotaria sp. Silwood1]
MTINNNPDRRNLYSQQTSTISNDFTPAQNAVLNLLKTVTSMTDYSVTEIYKPWNFFLVKVTFCSTTDDDHFRAASN